MADREETSKPELRLEQGQGATPAGLGELLVAHRMISQPQLRKALEAQAETGEPLHQVLLAKKYITEEALLRLLAARRGIRPWHLERAAPSPDAIAAVPVEVCRAHCVLPVKLRDDVVVLAMRDPDDSVAIEAVRRATDLRVEPVLALEDRLASSIDRAYGGNPAAPAERRSEPRIVLQPRPEVRPLTTEEAERVVGLMKEALIDALVMGSDIHVRLNGERVDVRYGVDGVRSAHRQVSFEIGEEAA